MLAALLLATTLFHDKPQAVTVEGLSPPGLRLERVTTAVPWPRGLVVVNGDLIVLARGRHRRAGGPSPAVEDMAGTLFRVRTDVFEVVVPGRIAGQAVRDNAEVMVHPTEPAFRFWNRSLVPASRDTRMDRPYCTLAWDELTGNYFICGFSGVDMTDGTFRKNATDSVLRYDTRIDEWLVVDRHEPEGVSEDQLGPWISNDTYPHHDPVENAAPHGWLNGPDGATVVGRWLYVAAKDNSRLVRYDLSAVADDPRAGPPGGEVALGEWVDVRQADGLTATRIRGHSAVEASDGYLYVGFRTTSQVVRFPLADDGRLAQPVIGEVVALFDPYDPQTGTSHDLMDMAFNSRGELFVSTARAGAVWRIGVPDAAAPFDGRAGVEAEPEPWLDLRALTGNPRGRTGNITFDAEDRLYVCSGNYDSGADTAGVIYRAVPAD